MAARGVLVAVLVTALGALAGCTASGGDERQRRPAVQGCGPIEAWEVGGRRPPYVRGPLDRFPNDHALCAGRWLPETGAPFVPQGLVVQGRTAWVSGYDGGGPYSTKYCRVVRVDLAHDRVVAQHGRIGGSVGPREPVECRHGGGLVIDEHGLWLTETTRVWLLDPQTLAVRRAWALLAPVQGGFAVHDGEGRIGFGDYRDHGRPAMWWYEPEDLLAADVLDVTTDLAVASQPVPTSSQGAFWADLGPGEAQTWFVSADSRCGRLVGAERRYGFLPGAEGAVHTDGALWVISESATEIYAAYGDRPVVPHLARFDLSGVRRWARPACSPSDP